MIMNTGKIDSNVIAKIIYNINNEEKEYLFIIKSDNKKTLNKAIELFLRLKNISFKSSYYLYLKRNNVIIRELDKNEFINKADIRTNDQIIILENKLKIFSNEDTNIVKISDMKTIEKDNDEIIYTYKKPHKRSIRNRNNYEKTIINKIVFYILLLLSIFIIIGLILFFILYCIVFRKKKKEEKSMIVENENLIIDIKYRLGILYKYENIKITKMLGGGGTESYNKEIIQLADIFFIIKHEYDEEEKGNNITKKWYSGFFGILNMTTKNDTGDMIMIYDKKLNNIINDENNQNPNLSLIGENGNLCFVKIDFYKNGEIKNISYPNNFSLSFMEYIKEYSQLIIPKISSDLYSDSINDALKDLEKDEEDLDETLNVRLLADNEKKTKKKKKIKRIKRILSNESLEEFGIEEYLTTSFNSSDSEDLELREKSNCTNCSEQNLNELSIKKVQNEEVDIEDSSVNKNVTRKINEENILESILEIEKMLIRNSPNEEELSDDGINMENEKNNSKEKKQDINFKIDNMYMEKINKINLTKKISQDKYIKNIYRYFENFQYELLDEKKYNDYIESQFKNILKNEYNLTEEEINIDESE